MVTNMEEMMALFEKLDPRWVEVSAARPRQEYGMSVHAYYDEFCIWKEQLDGLHYPANEEAYVADFFCGLKCDLVGRVYAYKFKPRRLSEAFYRAKFEESMLHLQYVLGKSTEVIEEDKVFDELPNSILVDQLNYEAADEASNEYTDAKMDPKVSDIEVHEPITNVEVELNEPLESIDVKTTLLKYEYGAEVEVPNVVAKADVSGSIIQVHMNKAPISPFYDAAKIEHVLPCTEQDQSIQGMHASVFCGVFLKSGIGHPNADCYDLKEEWNGETIRLVPGEDVEDDKANSDVHNKGNDFFYLPSSAKMCLFDPGGSSCYLCTWSPRSSFLDRKLYDKYGTFSSLICYIPNGIESAYARMMVEWFKMKLIYFDLYQATCLEKFVTTYCQFLKAKGEQHVIWKRASSMDEVFLEADVISLHPVLDKTTYHLVNKARLALMKKEVILINCNRWPVFYEGALMEHLKANPMFRVVLDVFEDEPNMKRGLADLKKAIVVPHIASTSKVVWFMSQFPYKNVVRNLIVANHSGVQIELTKTFQMRLFHTLALQVLRNVVTFCDYEALKQLIDGGHDTFKFEVHLFDPGGCFYSLIVCRDYWLVMWSICCLLARMCLCNDIFFYGHDNIDKFVKIARCLGKDELNAYLQKEYLKLAYQFECFIGCLISIRTRYRGKYPSSHFGKIVNGFTTGIGIITGPTFLKSFGDNDWMLVDILNVILTELSKTNSPKN